MAWTVAGSLISGRIFAQRASPSPLAPVSGPHDSRDDREHEVPVLKSLVKVGLESSVIGAHVFYLLAQLAQLGSAAHSFLFAAWDDVRFLAFGERAFRSCRVPLPDFVFAA